MPSCSRPGSDGDEVGFAHALVREVLYEGILPPRRRVWHRRVAEVLADVPGVDPDAVADHFQRAGDPRAIDWLVHAGERAQSAYALLTARDRFTAAVALLEGDEARAGERGWLLYRTGRLLRTADPNQGVAYLDEAERVARAVGDPVLAAYALFDRGSVWCFAGDQERGLAAMMAGAEALDALPPDHLRATPCWRPGSRTSGPGATPDPRIDGRSRRRRTPGTARSPCFWHWQVASSRRRRRRSVPRPGGGAGAP